MGVVKRASVVCVVGGSMEPGKGWMAAGWAREHGTTLPSPVREVRLHVQFDDEGLLIVTSDDPLVGCDDWFATTEEADRAALAWYGVRPEDWSSP
jgi:hypothetical protein